MKRSKQTGWNKTKLLVSIIVFAVIAALVVVYCFLDRVDLSSDERTNIANACSRCHRNPERLDHNAGKVHSIHTSADCITCHVGADGLETADNAHDIIEWVGIGIVGATVAGLSVNYFFARQKIGKVNGRKDS